MDRFWYPSAIAGSRTKMQNPNNVDDACARFLAHIDRSLRRHLHLGDDAEASPVWAGLGPRVVKFKREGSVSHGYTSFSLQRTASNVASLHNGSHNSARAGRKRRQIPCESEVAIGESARCIAADRSAGGRGPDADLGE